MNWALLGPEIILAIFAIAVIILDLFVKRKGTLAVLSILGLVGVIAATIPLWLSNSEIIREITYNPFFNGMLSVDRYALFFKVFFAGVAILIILASTDYVHKLKGFQGEYYALILLATLGMMFMAATRELISIYISLELTSISLYILAGFLKDNKSTEAGLKYMLLGSIASAILVYGMALVFGVTGTTHLRDIWGVVQTINGIGANPTLIMGMIFLIVGFGFKIASVPFQMWVPDVYEGAPTPITAYLSVASKAAGFAVILRVFFEAFGRAPWLAGQWGMIFAILSAVTMTVGNIVALSQTNIKRLLGYSSIAHAGYIMMGIAAAGVLEAKLPLARSGVLFYLVGYGLTNLGAFIAIIAISNKTGSDMIQDFTGMARRAPLLSLALAFTLISLTGLPPTAGFIAKIYIFNAALQSNLLWLVIVGVLNSVISAYYYLRIVKVMYLGEPASAEKIPSSGALRTALIISCGGVLFIGILPNVVLKITEAVKFLIS